MIECLLTVECMVFIVRLLFVRRYVQIGFHPTKLCDKGFYLQSTWHRKAIRTRSASNSMGY